MPPSPAIAVLSDDVLLFIFSIIAPSRWINDDLKSIRRVAQVCVHWRRIALGSTLLWRVIVIGKRPTKWDIELLRRVSLAKSIDVINNNNYGSLTSWIPKLRLPLRVYSGEPSVEELQWIVKGMQSPQGIMEYLNVTFLNHDFKSSHVVPFPSAHQVPSLKEIHLHSGMLDFSELLFPNLKILAMQWYELPISTLFRYLANFPSLAELSLTATIEYFSRVESLPTLDFPNLTRLQLLEDLNSGWHFLSYIRLPRKCHFHLDFVISGKEPAECYTSTVSFIFNRLKEFHIHKLAITQSTKGVSIATFNLDSVSPETSFKIDDIFGRGIPSNDHHLVRQQVSQTLHVLNFKDLEINMNFPGDSFCLASFPPRALENVKLTNCSVNFCESTLASILRLHISEVNPKIEVCKFLDVLKNMAVLESLHVENALIESPLLATSDHLGEKLTRVAFTGGGGTYGQLISNLSLPACQFKLDLTTENMEPYLYFIMNSFVQGIRHAQKDGTINSLEISQILYKPPPGYRRYDQNSNPGVTCLDSSLETESDADNKIHIRFPDFETPQQRIVMKSLLAALDPMYANLTVLNLCHISEMIPHLHKFPSLQILYITTIEDLDDPAHILPILKRTDVQDRPIFPSLTTVVLESHVRMTPAFFPMLYSVLDWRRTHQAPITQLVFSFYNSHFHITQFQRVHIETLQALGICIKTQGIRGGRFRDDIDFDSSGYFQLVEKK